MEKRYASRFEVFLNEDAIKKIETHINDILISIYNDMGDKRYKIMAVVIKEQEKSPKNNDPDFRESPNPIYAIGISVEDTGIITRH